MAAARIYPERPLIQMFLASYEQGAWKDATLNWVEETQENAVEVIATRSDGKTLALEHTLIELFVGERYDSTIFTQTFEPRIEKNQEFIIPGRALNVMIPVGALVGIKDRDAAGEALLSWMRANHTSIPPGDSEQTIMVGGLVPLKIEFQSDDGGGDVGYCWLARCDKPGISTRSWRRPSSGRYRSWSGHKRTSVSYSSSASTSRWATRRFLR